MENTTSMQFLLNRYNATQLKEKFWLVENKDKGWSFYVTQDAVYEHARPGEAPTVWEWKIDTQYFGMKEIHAADYLTTLVNEKNTGIRYIDHPKRKVCYLCGIEGRACRNPIKHNYVGCSDCPVAEEFFAKRDGVTLQYGEFDMFESGNTFSHILKNDTFNIRCNHCGRVVLKEDEESIDYPYYCPYCDENMYGIETYVGDWHTKEEFDELRCNVRDAMGLDETEETL